MEVVGGKKGNIAVKGREMDEDVNKYPHDSEAREVIKEGSVTAEGNFSRVPGATDNSGVHPYG